MAPGQAGHSSGRGHGGQGHDADVRRCHRRISPVILCGDAAHVNNPIGGLGLNSGIHEAWHLARLLSQQGADLDDYERRRRPLNIEYVQQQTIANKRRLEERDPAKRAERFAELRAMAQDAQKHEAFLMRASLLETWKA